MSNAIEQVAISQIACGDRFSFGKDTTVFRVETKSLTHVSGIVICRYGMKEQHSLMVQMTFRGYNELQVIRQPKYSL